MNKSLSAQSHSKSAVRAHVSPAQRLFARATGLEQMVRRAWAVLKLAIKKFLKIDGFLWTGAFAFNAFFSLFPLIVLLVTLASYFIKGTVAGTAIIGYAERFVPLSGDMQRTIFDTIAGVVAAHGRAGVVALPLLIWTAIQCFSTLISAINRAWGVPVHNWWQLPMMSLILFGALSVAVLLGITLPLVMNMARELLFPVYDFRSWVYSLGRFILPLSAVFFTLMLFYRFAPRRPTRIAEVWIGALCATVLLKVAGRLFMIYLKDFATLNAVYGAFGGIMALLLWIYLSGGIFIFGSCLCAAQAETPLPAIAGAAVRRKHSVRGPGARVRKQHTAFQGWGNSIAWYGSGEHEG